MYIGKFFPYFAPCTLHIGSIISYKRGHSEGTDVTYDFDNFLRDIISSMSLSLCNETRISCKKNKIKLLSTDDTTQRGLFQIMFENCTYREKCLQTIYMYMRITFESKL